LPLVGSIDTRRGQQILNTLLQGVAELHSQTVIIDLSGVRVVDTQVAQLLIRSATGARLLGAHVVLSGLSAEVAQTIVHLGVQFSDIDFHASLQDALAEHSGRANPINREAQSTFSTT
jgi:rsbT co-antagonist protein RsbR